MFREGSDLVRQAANFAPGQLPRIQFAEWAVIERPLLARRSLTCGWGFGWLALSLTKVWGESLEDDLETTSENSLRKAIVSGENSFSKPRICAQDLNSSARSHARLGNQDFAFIN